MRCPDADAGLPVGNAGGLFQLTRFDITSAKYGF